MTGPDAAPGDLPPAYLVAHVRSALASDPRTVELGIEVEVLPASKTIVLLGRVASEEIREMAGVVAVEEAPDHQVRNDLEVLDLDSTPDPPEHLR